MVVNFGWRISGQEIPVKQKKRPDCKGPDSDDSFPEEFRWAQPSAEELYDCTRTIPESLRTPNQHRARGRKQQQRSTRLIAKLKGARRSSCSISKHGSGGCDRRAARSVLRGMEGGAECQSLNTSHLNTVLSDHYLLLLSKEST